jgi:hypothetical protein
MFSVSNWLQVLLYDTRANSEAALKKLLLRPVKAGQASCYALLRSSYAEASFTSEKLLGALALQALAQADAIRDAIDYESSDSSNSSTAAAATAAAVVSNTAASNDTATTTTTTTGDDTADTTGNACTTDSSTSSTAATDSVITVSVSFEVVSVTQKLVADRTTMRDTFIKAGADAAPVTWFNVCRSVRRRPEWQAVMALAEKHRVPALFSAVPRDGAAARGELSADTHSSIAEAVAMQQSDYTKFHTAAAHYATRVERLKARQQYHDTSVAAAEASIEQDPRLVAAAAALKAVDALKEGTTGILCGRTSPKTEGADMRAELNRLNSSCAVQVAEAAVHYRAMAGSNARTVTVLFTSDAGASTGGRLAEMLAALGRKHDTAVLSGLHRVGRDRHAAAPLTKSGLNVAVRYPSDELSLLYPPTRAGTKQYLVLLWGLRGLSAALAACPNIIDLVHAYKQLLVRGPGVVARMVLPFLVIPNATFTDGGENSLLMQMLGKGELFLYTFPLYKHITQYTHILKAYTAGGVIDLSSVRSSAITVARTTAAAAAAGVDDDGAEAAATATATTTTVAAATADSSAVAGVYSTMLNRAAGTASNSRATTSTAELTDTAAASSKTTNSITTVTSAASDRAALDSNSVTNAANSATVDTTAAATTAAAIDSATVKTAAAATTAAATTCSADSGVQHVRKGTAQGLGPDCRALVLAIMQHWLGPRFKVVAMQDIHTAARTAKAADMAQCLCRLDLRHSEMWALISLLRCFCKCKLCKWESSMLCVCKRLCRVGGELLCPCLVSGDCPCNRLATTSTLDEISADDDSDDVSADVAQTQQPVLAAAAAASSSKRGGSKSAGSSKKTRTAAERERIHEIQNASTERARVSQHILA